MGENFVIKKVYYYDKKIYNKDYSIIVSGKYLSNNDIDDKLVELFIIENLDKLFMTKNEKKQCEVLDKYLSINGDLSYVVNAIRNCTSFAVESELAVSVLEGGKVIQNVSYINGILCSYTSVSNLNDCILNTTYGVGNGINFGTKYDFSSYKYIQELVEYEYKNLYNLINYNNKCACENGENVFKLVRKNV